MQFPRIPTVSSVVVEGWVWTHSEPIGLRTMSPVGFTQYECHLVMHG